MTRQADAAAGICANVERRRTRRDDRSCTAAASAGCPRQVERIVGTSVDEIVGLEPEREFRGIGFAHQYGAGVLQPGDAGRVSARAEILASERAPGGNGIDCVEAVLDGHGNAV
ncbi:MAG: hypothetical protein U5O39_09165 [Gammaproteobacteria bacterium]|nr:hypothetical protein [Gammaproteobacteria bacterium]